MNVSGIRPIGGYYNISSAERVGQSARTAAASEAGGSGSSTSSQSNALADAEKIAEAKQKQTFKAPDFDALYQPESRQKVENTLRTADVERAVSDMQKDEVLHQYQYFVGEAGSSSPDPAEAAENATVRGAEDFTF